MSAEDKIRRAEEIYYRRREQNLSTREKNRTSSKKNNIKLIRKMVRQIIACLIIYTLFYMIINNNYIFSDDFTSKAKEILEQDINFVQVYSAFSRKIEDAYNNIKNMNGKQDSQEQLQDGKDENQALEKQSQENEEETQNAEEQIEVNEEDNIGGADEGNKTSELSQMEQDADYIKNTISFIKPIEGKVSSKFGWRNPTTETVPKNHTGTDIAQKNGTKILSATDGTVMLASSVGDYGNHLKIQINEVVIVYAHCNKLYVTEGDIVKQGQEIAEVGATGNTTGPHLHFEIRYQERYVDPQLILEL